VQKTLLIGSHEFRQKVRSRGFWLTSVGVPLVMLVIWAVTGGLGGAAAEPTAELEEADRPEQAIGYVDQAGLIRTIPDPIPEDMFQSFADVEQANAALERGDIAAYYLIRPDYRESGDVRRISPHFTVNPPDVRWFNRLLAANLMPEAEPHAVDRLRRPFYEAGLQFVNVTSEDQSKGQGNEMLPFLVTIAILVPLFTGGGYLFQSLTQEKSSRVMEILLVTVRPRQLLTGKLLGLSVLTLVQYGIWGALGLIALLVIGQDVARPLAGLSLSAIELVLIVPFALGGFLLYAALMAGIGALVRDVEDGRVWLFVISLPMMIPIYLWVLIAGDPNGLLAVGLSLFPFSASVAMLMRLTRATVPAWQIGLSLGLLLLTAFGVIVLMARLFHARTLLSGESLSVRRFLAVLRS
jgi:ABC-2 type transport system permease protein